MTNKDEITLYRKDSNGKISYWRAYVDDNSTGLQENTYIIEHGKVGSNKPIRECITTHRKAIDEIKSKYKAKRKVGYLAISDIKDNTSIPVNEELYNYLNTYLPDNRTTDDGSLLPMLAKVYDNTGDKMFKNNDTYIGQWKINGLRCFISAVENPNNLFEPIKFVFQSREGTKWNSLDTLNQYLLHAINYDLLTQMLYNGWVLDGELYLPGYSVNEINHFVKNTNCIQNKLIQFWCYDIAIPDCTQQYRTIELANQLRDYTLYIKTKEDHLNVKSLLNALPYFAIDCDLVATNTRNDFIKQGFEGLILRKLDAEYQYGKRNSAMWKYKKSTDGKFTIVDIKPEGIKRPDIPLFVCRNDINSAEFEVHLSDTLEVQRRCMKFKNSFIGHQLFIEYGERSGVEQVPFHVKNVRFVNNNLYSILK